MKQNNADFMELFETTEKEDKEVRFLSHEIRSGLSELAGKYFEDEESDQDLLNILLTDDYLTELLVDRTAYLNIVESELGDAPIEALAKEDAPFSRADVEAAYLSVIDALFELSKLINPLGGFGKDRLEAGLSLIENFEERYWSTATRITEDNAQAFKDLIPPEHYDDILAGRKRAIGALRQVGERTCAAA